MLFNQQQGQDPMHGRENFRNQGGRHEPIQGDRTSSARIRASSDPLLSKSLTESDVGDQLKSQFAQIDESLSSEDALCEKLKLLQKRCGAGKCRETLEEVLQAVGKGSDRESMILQIFSSKGGSIGEFIALLPLLSDPSEKAKAISGISIFISKSDDIESLRPAFSTQDQQVMEGVVKGIGAWISRNGQQGPAATELLLGQVKNLLQSAPKDFRTPLLNSICYQTSIGKIGSFGTWAFLESNGLLEKGGSPELVQRLAYEMLRTDQKEALRILGSCPVTDGFRFAVSSLIKKDIAAAEEWLASNRSSLSQESRGIACLEFSRKYLESGDIEKAQAIEQQVEDDKTGSLIASLIRNKREEIIRGDVVREPKQTLDSIVDGASNYESDFLEIAMEKWLSIDFDSACVWYKSEWEKLPPDKSQYLAAAFSLHAARQGDNSTAIQWTHYIVDPEVRSRIESSIREASK